MKLIIAVIIMLGGFRSVGAGTPPCRCDYYSPVNFDRYKAKIDSVFAKIGRPQETLLIGARNFSQSNVMIIIISGKGQRGFLYDFVKNEKKEIPGKSLANLRKSLMDNKKVLTSDRIIEKQNIDHDHSYVFSFDYAKSRKLFEICFSQLMTIRKEKAARPFMNYQNFIR